MPTWIYVILLIGISVLLMLEMDAAAKYAARERKRLENIINDLLFRITTLEQLRK